MFRLPSPDGSRDPRIEDPTNRWIVHLAGRLLLPLAIRLRIPANLVSIVGLAFGAAAAWCYWDWQDPASALLGFLFCIAWLIADGLDGMIARATGTTSALGRVLDGMCDHMVFVLLYVTLGWSIDTPQSWTLGSVAGVAHALQATLYEGERVRFHRRLRGDPGGGRAAPSRLFLVRLYDKLATSLDRWAAPFDRMLARSNDPERLGRIYGAEAAPALRFMWVLSNNMRVITLYLACLAGDAQLFWWLEVGPLSLIAVTGIILHRRAEARLVERHAASIQADGDAQ